MVLKSKRASHVGVVISFVLFITFVMFMFILLEYKVNQQSGKANTLEFVEAEVLKRVTAEMKTISVKLQDPTASCVELADFLTTAGVNNKILVRDDGGILNKGVSGGNIQVERTGTTFFHVYESEEFDSVTSGLSSCDDTGYDIGLAKTEEFVFESKIEEFIANYSVDYEEFKKDLNIGSRDEFGLVFTFANGETLKTVENNVAVNVYASRLPVQYIKADGSREAGTLSVLVW